MNLIERCTIFENLFDELLMDNGRTYKEVVVKDFLRQYPELKDDFDFVFEVLAGKHKLGFTVYDSPLDYSELYTWETENIRQLHTFLKAKGALKTEIRILEACAIIPTEIREFIINLFNRNYKLGYSNKDNQITNYSPMLAKKYPEAIKREQYYYIQEKLDGNRCIAHYNFETDKWEFTSRSGKPLKVEFDMSWADKDVIFDGEIMTLDKAGTRDFTATSGVINSKYLDKSQLHYYIYDIVDDKRTYEERRLALEWYEDTGKDCSMVPILDKIVIHINPEYNEHLDRILDDIVAKGGEGVMLRDPDAVYQIGKRSDALIKYKKLQTMDLRIVGFNEGKGKYEGMIGSFVCRTDDGEIVVDVAGITDEMRAGFFGDYANRIIEVAYFDISENKQTGQKSLRFPRFVKFRDDKNETSIY